MTHLSCRITHAACLGPGRELGREAERGRERAQHLGQRRVHQVERARLIVTSRRPSRRQDAPSRPSSPARALAMVRGARRGKPQLWQDGVFRATEDVPLCLATFRSQLRPGAPLVFTSCAGSDADAATAQHFVAQPVDTAAGAERGHLLRAGAKEGLCVSAASGGLALTG